MMKNLNNLSKFEWVHADTCLSDYWGGHHLPHIQIPVYNGMTLKEIKTAIKYELSQGFVGGSDDIAMLLSSDYVGAENEKVADLIFKKAGAAANRLKPTCKGQRRFFKDLEEDEDGIDSVYAFFVLKEI